MNDASRRAAVGRRPGPQGWLGAGLLITMSGLTVVAMQLPPPQFEPVGARLFALVVPLALCLLGAILILQNVVAPPRVGKSQRRPEARRAVMGCLAIFGVLVAYAYLVSLGLSTWLYVLASTAFAGTVAALAARSVQIGALLLAAAAGGVLAAGIAFSFSSLLYVDIVRWQHAGIRIRCRRIGSYGRRHGTSAGICRRRIRRFRSRQECA